MYDLISKLRNAEKSDAISVNRYEADHACANPTGAR